MIPNGPGFPIGTGSTHRVVPRLPGGQQASGLLRTGLTQGSPGRARSRLSLSRQGDDLPGWRDRGKCSRLGVSIAEEVTMANDPTDILGAEPGGTDELGPEKGGTDILGAEPGGTDELGPEKGGTDELGPEKGGTDELRPG
jgi:hypothetical protein